VWVRLALRRARGERPAEGASHFGDAPGSAREGPPRVVGVAFGEDHAHEAAAWLERARAAGADCALVTDAELPPGEVRVRRIEGRSPGRLAIALDAEHQLRAIDLVLVAGRRERLMARTLPRALRGAAQLAPADDPRRVSEIVASTIR
jgi:hypothetical protein